MSQATKRKYVSQEVLDEYVLPEGKQQIVKITSSRGNNLHEVVTAEEEKFLVSMPTKYRKHVWIKRGDYVLVDPIEEGAKVRAEIVNILFKDQIKYIKQEGKWPSAFSNEVETEKDGNQIPYDLLPPSDDDEDDNSSTPPVVNANRQAIPLYKEDSESEESNEEDETN